MLNGGHSISKIKKYMFLIWGEIVRVSVFGIQKKYANETTIIRTRLSFHVWNHKFFLPYISQWFIAIIQEIRLIIMSDNEKNFGNQTREDVLLYYIVKIYVWDLGRTAIKSEGNDG